MDIRIIDYLDYREIIRVLCKKTKISQKNLALSAGIHTSYFSRVMNGGAEFSTTQLYLIGTDLSLSGWEMDYFLLIGEYLSASHHRHRTHLLGKIKEEQKKRAKIISKLKDVETELSEELVREYYAEAVTAKIHMLLTIDKYRKNPNLICSKILIPEFKLNIEMQKLLRLGILGKENEEWKVLKFNVHLDEASDISPMNHINWRLESIKNIQKRTPRPSDYHMSAVFSTDENGKLKIKEMFKDFVVNAQKVAGTIKDQEDVFHISFDLF